MRKKCAWLLMLILFTAFLAPKVAYATEADGETQETVDSPEETEPARTEAAERQPQDAEKSLKEAMEKSPYGADEVIADGVYIDTVDVSGLTAEQALKAVQSHVDEIGKKTLTLTLEGAEGVEPITTTAADLGLHTDELSSIVMEALALGKGGNLIVRYKAEKDLQVSNQVYEFGLAVDEKRIEEFVTEKTSGLTMEPVEAELTRTSGGFSVTESQNGITVDVPATVSEVQAAFRDWKREDVSLAAVAEIIVPKKTTELLSQVQDKLGSFSTSTKDTSRGKLQNLDRGVELTNDILLMPGESWSMHDALAPFSAENGYTQQIAYQAGGYVQEYGGGICQLATTLYNTALLAEVYISKRSNHSMTVNYTYWGLDATINDGGSKDLELTNDFDFPIYIEAYHNGGGKVTYTIWGKETRPSNRTLKFYGVTLSEEYLEDEITVDPNMAPGTEEVKQATSYPKATAEAYKEIYVDGVLEERIKLHTDKYQASPRKVVKGPDLPIDPVTGLPIDPNAPTTPETPAPETSAPETPAPEAPAPTDAPTEAPAPTPAPEPAPAA
ncbi:MAG: hypothetical protein HFI67_06725 [Lachnospiraceae bacterium]|jgi:vancomycin resistance protein YoaR|nr:hypothetical protein [Lachnospiraceae bacterium]